MFAVEPIGVAHTPFPAHVEIPRQGGPGTVEVFPQFAAGLDGIERSTHVWVIAWLDAASRSVTTRGRKAPPDQPARGVFAMRAPSRPNPLSLSAARLVAREGNVLRLDRLDLRDDTPVVDIKPYSPGWDLIPWATSGHSYDPSRYDRAELREALERDACNALGPGAMNRPRVAALVDALLRIAFDRGLDVRASEVAYRLEAADERVEVLMCATGATLGNGRLAIGHADLAAREVFSI